MTLSVSMISITMVLMVWLRKGIVWLLSLILFFVLIDGVVAASLDMNFGTPSRLESLLDSSGLYNSFVSAAIREADNTAQGSGNMSNGVSLSDAAVQQAAEATFPPSLIQSDVNTVINSNYAWLEGKTATPQFSIDLTSAKQNFAQQVGQYVETHIGALPLCSPAEALAESQTTDPLQLSCRPPNISPEAVGAQVSQQLASNSGFLNNTVITADSINPNANGKSKPYYQQLSQVPKIYRLAKALPWILLGVLLLCIIGIYFISPDRRKGIRKISFALLEAGILLAVIKYGMDAAFKHIEDRIFNQASVGPLQRTLTGVVEHIVHSINLDNFYFGIAFMVVAVILFIYLIATHGRQHQTAIKGKDTPQQTADTPVSNQKGKVNAASAGTAEKGVPSSFAQRPKPKRNRLIQ